ncbi:MAG: hypothetical protein R3301_19605, partial [Saprospiraceae bacterium]|nr:hypothetical protein [Saprospiraceae bacterium]
QCFFGGEWIYESFEPKTVAYIFVFWGLYYWMSERWRQSLLCLAGATYFHLLVGGWTVIALGVHALLSRQLLRRWREFGLYGIVILPILGYVLYGSLKNAPTDAPVNLDWVYVYYRLPNHLGIFRSIDYFLQAHAAGVMIGILAYVYAWWRHHRLAGLARRINHLILIVLTINLAFVLVAFADHLLLDNSGGLLLKIYPFRSNSLAYFLFVLLLFDQLRAFVRRHARRRLISRSVVLLFLLLTCLFAFFNIRRSFDSFRDPAFDQMARDIDRITERDAVVALMDLGPSGVMYNSFSRKANRENFSVFKFVPYQRDKLYAWYMRTLDLQMLWRDPDHSINLQDIYGVDYVLSRGQLTSSHLTLHHDNGTYFLYNIQ